MFSLIFFAIIGTLTVGEACPDNVSSNNYTASTMRLETIVADAKSFVSTNCTGATTDNLNCTKIKAQIDVVKDKSRIYYILVGSHEMGDVTKDKVMDALGELGVAMFDLKGLIGASK